MLAKVLISKINKNKRSYDRLIYRNRNGKAVPETIVVQPMLCEVGDIVGIIGQYTFVYKDGFFYSVINKRNEIFSLYQEEIDFNGIFIPKETIIKSRIPLFSDCIEPEIFSLDLL